MKKDTEKNMMHDRNIIDVLLHEGQITQEEATDLRDYLATI